MTREEANSLVNALFDEWYPSLLRYACRLTGSLELAEDAVQESFLHLFRELARGGDIENPKAWTLCVLRRQVNRQGRGGWGRDHRSEPVEVLDNLPVDWHAAGMPPGFEYDEIARMFSLLTPREEEVLLLRMEAMKYREIGTRLGISANSVNVLLARALRKLQAAVKAIPAGRVAAAAGKRNVPKTLQ